MGKLGVTGLEPPTVTTCKDSSLRKSSAAGGAESGAVGRQTTPDDPELRRVVAAWPTLLDPIRRAVLALVDTVSGVTGTETPADADANGGFGDKSAAVPSPDDSSETGPGTPAGCD